MIGYLLFGGLTAGAIYLLFAGGERRVNYLPASGQLYPLFCALQDAGATTDGQVALGGWRAVYEGVPPPKEGSPPENIAAWAWMVEEVHAWIAAGTPCEPPPLGPLVVGPAVGPVAPVEPVVPVVPPVEPVPVTPVVPPAAPDMPTFVDSLITAEPTPGFFYQVRDDDNPTLVARAVYGLPTGSILTQDVLNCITSAKWNTRLYGAGAQPGVYGSYTDPAGVTSSLKNAFLPKHWDAAGMMRNGQAPLRNIDWNGRLQDDAGRNYALLWIPPMTRAGGSVFCPSSNPDDPAINPPVELLAALGITDVATMGV